MKSLDKKMVLDYINGNDINEVSIDELENNVDFMKEVIKITKDKNMCNFCSDSVLKNYEFVKYVVETFKDDVPFITKIANNFLEYKSNSETDIESIELNIIMENIIGNRNNDENIEQYRLANQVFYSSFLVGSEIAKQKDNIDEDNDLGLGFVLVENMYPSSKVIKDYFAKKFLNDLFYDNDLPFEDLIHKIAKDKINIEDNKINNFINNFLMKYDTNLAWYVLVNNKEIKSLDRIKKDIKKVYIGWDKKVFQQNTYNIGLFEDLVRRFYEENEPNTSSYLFSELEKYILEMYDLKNIYLNSEFKEDYNEFLNDIELDMNDFNTLNLTDMRFIKYASDLARKIFIDKEQIDENEYLYPTKNENARIIKLNLKNNI